MRSTLVMVIYPIQNNNRQSVDRMWYIYCNHGKDITKSESEKEAVNAECLMSLYSDYMDPV